MHGNFNTPFPRYSQYLQHPNIVLSLHYHIGQICSLEKPYKIQQESPRIFREAESRYAVHAWG